MIWILVIILLFVGAGAWLFYAVPSVNAFFRDSETMVIQTAKAVGGVIAGILALVDPDLLRTATQTIVTNLGLAQWWPIYAVVFALGMMLVNRFRQKPG